MIFKHLKEELKQHLTEAWSGVQQKVADKQMTNGTEEV